MADLSRRHETYRRQGDALHAFTLLNTAAFCVCVLSFKDGPLFDPTWAKDGFCVSNVDVPYWSSHDLSLYADVVLAAVGAAAYLSLRKEDGMGPANAYMLPNILGVLFHGFAHGGLGASLRDPSKDEFNADDVSYFSAARGKPWGAIARDLATEGAPLLLFWLVLLRAAMPDAAVRASLPLSLLAWLGALSVGRTFGFAYTQTVLLVAFSVNQLSRPREDKGYAYLTYALIVSFGVPLVGWIESTMCTSVVIHVGGHLIYDAFIAASGLVFYLHYYAHRGSETAKVKSD